MLSQKLLEALCWSDIFSFSPSQAKVYKLQKLLNVQILLSILTEVYKSSPKKSSFRSKLAPKTISPIFSSKYMLCYSWVFLGALARTPRPENIQRESSREHPEKSRRILLLQENYWSAQLRGTCHSWQWWAAPSFPHNPRNNPASPLIPPWPQHKGVQLHTHSLLFCPAPEEGHVFSSAITKSKWEWDQQKEKLVKKGAIQPSSTLICKHTMPLSPTALVNKGKAKSILTLLSAQDGSSHYFQFEIFLECTKCKVVQPLPKTEGLAVADHKAFHLPYAGININ